MAYNHRWGLGGGGLLLGLGALNEGVYLFIYTSTANLSPPMTPPLTNIMLKQLLLVILRYNLYLYDLVYKSYISMMYLHNNRMKQNSWESYKYGSANWEM